jgi:hypothetical protein
LGVAIIKPESFGGKNVQASISVETYKRISTGRCKRTYLKANVCLPALFSAAAKWSDADVLLHDIDGD